VPEVTVLVCVRTNMAASTVASCAARLGVATAVRTAVSEAEAMARLTERPADVVLADTALTRPDSVGFTQRVLARAPQATLVLFGPEDPRVAAASVAAGARGLIRGTDQDLVSVVAKALLLVLPAMPAAGKGAPPLPSGVPAIHPGVLEGPERAGGRGGPGRAGMAGLAGGPDGPDGPGLAGWSGDGATTIVPVQRSDLPHGYPDGRPQSPYNGRTGGLPAGTARGGPGGLPPGGAPGAPARRTALTERELQVLRGMADGKSNAEIGRELFVSEDTVKTHARRLFRKLGARDRAHAVAAGFRAGLVV
jgi:DNA-binding NarL/FixJ family response regulator